MKYVFILGRNPELSIAEIFSYFKKQAKKIISSKIIKNSVLIEFEDKIEKGVVDNLGGTLAIGEVLCEIELKELNKQEIYSGTKNNINYVVWNFSDEEHEKSASEYLKKRFKEERLKASEKNLTGSLELQEGKTIRISSGLIDEEYFVFDRFFGKIIEKCDYKTLEARDMKKPERRHELSISPRLAKTMINLSQTKKGETILDPFCGIGTILIEALNQGINAVGIDKDETAVSGAKKNLEWFKFSKNNYKILLGDSGNIKPEKVNAIVTEPNLVQILKKMPSKEEAEKILEKYECLMIRILNHLKNSVSRKIVFTSPLIDQKSKRVSCNIKKILEKTRLKLIKGPIPEYRKGQIVGRNIFVLER